MYFALLAGRIRGSMGVRLNIAIKRIIAWTGEGTDKNKITNLVISPVNDFYVRSNTHIDIKLNI